MLARHELGHERLQRSYARRGGQTNHPQRRVHHETRRRRDHNEKNDHRRTARERDARFSNAIGQAPRRERAEQTREATQRKDIADAAQGETDFRAQMGTEKEQEAGQSPSHKKGGQRPGRRRPGLHESQITRRAARTRGADLRFVEQ